MKTIVHEIPYSPASNLDEEIFTASSVFFDIETTGFSPAHTSLYLIGCAYHIEQMLYIKQFFAETPEEEKEVLEQFLLLLDGFDTIITFNGIGFDIPYLKAKCNTYECNEHFADFTYVDIFKSISQIKHILQLSNYKQKTIEAFLGIGRNDLYSGGELIEIYHSYTKEPRPDKLEILLLHNYEDVLDMPALLPVLSYVHLFYGQYLSCSASISEYTDYKQQEKKELILSIEPEFPFPKHISCRMGSVYFYAKGKKCTLSVRLEEDALKYFFPNYKDYYYLPDEDRAVHKKVGQYVDPEHRVQVSASTCYTKKSSTFLPLSHEDMFDLYKEEYSSKQLFTEYIADPDFILAYAHNVLEDALRCAVPVPSEEAQEAPPELFS